MRLKKHLPIVLSVTALMFAVLGTTPLGQAALNAVPFATNSGAVNGIKASRIARPGYLVALNRFGKFPASVGQVGPRGLQGPQGLQGSAGPTGAAGAAGAAGAPGVSAYQVVTADSASDSSSSKSLNAACPSPKKVLGGGGQILNIGSREEVALDLSGPDGTTGWLIGAHEVNSTSTNWTLRVWAICATVT